MSKYLTDLEQVYFFVALLREAILVINAIAPKRVAAVYFAVVNKSMGFSLTFLLGKGIFDINDPSVVSLNGNFARTSAIIGDTKE